MNYKDLAEEYSIKEYARVNGANDSVFIDNRCFTFYDIKAAFNAGRDSVLESLPELKWRKEIYGGKSFLEAYALGAFYLIRLRGPEFHVSYNYSYFASYTSLTAAKQAANEDYKKRIKQVLGL